MQVRLEEAEAKLRDTEENIQNIVLEKADPFACVSITRDEKGEIVVLNRTEEEAEFIRSNLYNEDIIEMSKSKEQRRKEEL